MKVLLIAFLAFTAAAVASPIQEYPSEDELGVIILVRNIIDNLIRQALEYIRQLLKENEPFEVPDIPAQRIVDKDIDLTIEVKSVKLSKASEFTIKNIENNLPGLWAKFDVEVPHLHLEGQYEVTGTVQGRKIQGKGKGSADLDSMDQSGYIKVTIKNHEVQMKELTLDYDLKALDFHLDGLSIEGMTKEQVEDLLNKQFISYLQTNKKDVCDFVGKQVMIKANQLMAGKSLKELLDWLKNMMKH